MKIDHPPGFAGPLLEEEGKHRLKERAMQGSPEQRDKPATASVAGAAR